MSKQYLTYQRIIDYLKGLLSDRQRHELEKEVMRDAFEEEAFDGLNQLSPDEFEADMKSMEEWLDKRTEKPAKRLVPLYYRIAASIFLVLGLGSVLYMTVFNKPKERDTGYIAEQNEIARPEMEEPDETEILKKEPAPYQAISSDAVQSNSEVTAGSDNIRQQEPEIYYQEINEEISPVSEYNADMDERMTDASGSIEKKAAEEAMSIDDQGRIAARAPAQSSPQLKSYSARLVDNNGQPVSGVAVFEQGIIKGAVTDMNGAFSLESGDASPPFTVSAVIFREMEEQTGSKEPVSGGDPFYDALALKELIIKSSSVDRSQVVYNKAANFQTEPAGYQGAIPTIEVISPVPPGGTMRAYKSLVENNLNAQRLLAGLEQLDEITGRYRINITITVFEDGSVGNIRSDEDIPQLVADEYKRSIEKTVSWKPAMQGDTPVESEVEMRFTLSIE